MDPAAGAYSAFQNLLAALGKGKEWEERRQWREGGGGMGAHFLGQVHASDYGLVKGSREGSAFWYFCPLLPLHSIINTANPDCN